MQTDDSSSSSHATQPLSLMAPQARRLRWQTLPSDAGQMIAIEYASSDGYLYRRITDRSAGGVRPTHHRVAWDTLAPPEGVVYAPQNGDLGAGRAIDESEWTACADPCA